MRDKILSILYFFVTYSIIFKTVEKKNYAVCIIVTNVVLYRSMVPQKTS